MTTLTTGYTPTTDPITKMVNQLLTAGDTDFFQNLIDTHLSRLSRAERLAVYNHPRIEKAARKIEADELRKLAAGLGLTHEYLATLIDHAPKNVKDELIDISHGVANAIIDICEQTTELSNDTRKFYALPLSA